MASPSITDPVNGNSQLAKHMNLNTLIVSVGFAFMGFMGRELYSEIRSTHDAVLILQTTTSIQISELKDRMLQIEKRLANLEERKAKQ